MRIVGFCIGVSIFAAICIVARLASNNRARYAAGVRWLALAAAAGVLGAFAPQPASNCAALAACALVIFGLTRETGDAVAGAVRDGSPAYSAWRTGLSENEQITQEYLARKHGLPIDTERLVERNGRPEQF